MANAGKFEVVGDWVYCDGERFARIAPGITPSNRAYAEQLLVGMEPKEALRDAVNDAFDKLSAVIERQSNDHSLMTHDEINALIKECRPK